MENTSPRLFSFSIGDGVVITLLATGVRNQTDLGAFALLLGDGVDIVQAQLPGGVTGEYDIVLTVDGKASNALHTGP